MLRTAQTSNYVDSLAASALTPLIFRLGVKCKGERNNRLDGLFRGSEGVPVDRML